MSDRENIEQAIAALEARRGLLGDTVFELAVRPLREQAAALTPRFLPRELAGSETGAPSYFPARA